MVQNWLFSWIREFPKGRRIGFATVEQAPVKRLFLLDFTDWHFAECAKINSHFSQNQLGPKMFEDISKSLGNFTHTIFLFFIFLKKLTYFL